MYRTITLTNKQVNKIAKDYSERLRENLTKAELKKIQQGKAHPSDFLDDCFYLAESIEKITKLKDDKLFLLIENNPLSIFKIQDLAHSRCCNPDLI